MYENGALRKVYSFKYRVVKNSGCWIELIRLVPLQCGEVSPSQEGPACHPHHPLGLSVPSCLLLLSPNMFRSESLLRMAISPCSSPCSPPLCLILFIPCLLISQPSRSMSEAAGSRLWGHRPLENKCMMIQRSSIRPIRGARVFTRPRTGSMTVW